MRAPIWVLSLVLMVPHATAAPSTKRGTSVEAKEMLGRAVAYYHTYGRKKALLEFNKGEPSFRDGDLYVFCIGPDRRFVANGMFPEFVGHLADTIKDVNGNSVAEAGWKIATTKGEGEVHYKWPSPESGLSETKVSFFARAGRDVCGVGAYDSK